MASSARPKGIRLRTSFVTENEFIAAFQSLCDESTLFVPTDKLYPADTNCYFSLELVDEAPMLRGLGVVIDSWSIAQNPFNRPGIHVRITQLTTLSEPIFERVLAARPSALHKKGPRTRNAPMTHQQWGSMVEPPTMESPAYDIDEKTATSSADAEETRPAKPITREMRSASVSVVPSSKPSSLPSIPSLKPGTLKPNSGPTRSKAPSVSAAPITELDEKTSETTRYGDHLRLPAAAPAAAAVGSAPVSAPARAVASGSPAPPMNGTSTPDRGVGMAPHAPAPAQAPALPPPPSIAGTPSPPRASSPSPGRAASPSPARAPRRSARCGPRGPRARPSVDDLVASRVVEGPRAHVALSAAHRRVARCVVGESPRRWCVRRRHPARGAVHDRCPTVTSDEGAGARGECARAARGGVVPARACSTHGRRGRGRRCPQAASRTHQGQREGRSGDFIGEADPCRGHVAGDQACADREDRTDEQGRIGGADGDKGSARDNEGCPDDRREVVASSRDEGRTNRHEAGDDCNCTGDEVRGDNDEDGPDRDENCGHGDDEAGARRDETCGHGDDEVGGDDDEAGAGGDETCGHVDGEVRRDDDEARARETDDHDLGDEAGDHERRCREVGDAVDEARQARRLLVARLHLGDHDAYATTANTAAAGTKPAATATTKSVTTTTKTAPAATKPATTNVAAAKSATPATKRAKRGACSSLGCI